MSFAFHTSFDSAMKAAYFDVPSMPDHQVIVKLNTADKFAVVSKNAIPPGFYKLSLNEINDIVLDKIQSKELNNSGKYAEAMQYMGNRKMSKSYSGFIGSLRWFFTCLANLLICKGFATSADSGKTIAEIIVNQSKHKPTIEKLNAFADKEHGMKKNPAEYRAKIFEQTQYAVEHGYQFGDKHIMLDNDAMINGTVTFDATTVSKLPPVTNKYKTSFTVTKDDTFNVMIKHVKAGENVVGINMANAHHPGGGVIQGCPAQEEALCRRSNHYLGLTTQQYPLFELGGIYCPNVSVFREDENTGYVPMDTPVMVNLVAVAAEDLRGKNNDIDVLRQDAQFMTVSAERIRNMLRVMFEKGHTTLVLGALGCGAFANPPVLIAEIFKDVFNEDEFKGRFKHVDFAILCQYAKDLYNVDAFQAVCEELSQ